jgi:hypothetical protein
MTGSAGRSNTYDNNYARRTFLPYPHEHSEQVSYGEEGDFYLIFTISSRSKATLAKAMNAYYKFIGGYKEKP